ncbi:type VII secretion protein EccCa [Virgisporangium aurantiacum]|uniref:Type VII secretion protein EccC n=1 Tax=Virgisporangium aurantiacum TaxID=175570 RepID=A0A8J4E5L4_9ACTN|nr:type VII secretion protein EccCa [Virgisporangium aurantiacum]GIJ62441.1 type VII secretion protein EccC [Virgisporangium aurantiacum]
MTVKVFRRPARRDGPEVPAGEFSLQEPPAIPDVQSNGLRSAMMILPMMLMTGVMVMMFFGRGRGALTWVMMGLIGVATAGMLVGQMLLSGGERKKRVGGDRRDYLRYLGQQRKRIRAVVTQQREAGAWRHPEPAGLWAVAMTSRRWERRPTHPDFLELRVGTGRQRLAVRIAPLSTKPIEDLEPLSAKSLRRFINAYSTVPDQPVALLLSRFSEIRLTGEADARRALARALIGQLATFHAPEEVTIALCVAADRRGDWDWAKWLPHLQHLRDQDGAGPVRLAADGMDTLERLLGEEFQNRPRWEAGTTASRDEPFLVVVRDGGQVAAGSRLTSGGYRNAVLLDLSGDPPATTPRELLWLDIAEGCLERVRYDMVGRETRSVLAIADGLSMARSHAVARMLSPYRLGMASEPAAQALASDFDLGTLLGLGDLATLDVDRAWAARSPTDRLRVPIGLDAGGAPVELDIKESASGGMGPHGMLVGATGSGKSELLRTLVLALAATHPSETLNFVLVDFKGGATFLGLEQLPHTSAVITNLSDEVALVGRMREALHGELVRRQELLRQAGGYSSALDYERARAQGVPLEALPTLFVVVDEFSELLASHRDFIDLFVMIGRLGRSLAVHLLLASQRLDEGRITQLESHLSYRIGLRTFSAMESRAAIGVPDAHELPSQPGSGIIRTDVSTLVRFKAAYVSGPYRPKLVRTDQEVVERQVVPFGLDRVEVRQPDRTARPQPAPESPERPTVMSVVVDRLAGRGAPARQIWLPPLDRPPTLDQLLPPLRPDPHAGLRAAGWPGNGALVVPVGFVDRPFEQARELLLVDLAGVGGHVGVAGGPQSGKSTLLRALICSLALTHSPREVQFYCLDFGGGTLGSIESLPHVGSVAGRLNTELVSRTVAEVSALITEREQRFAELGIDSMAMYRRRRAEGTVDDPYGDVFLVVDGWFTLRQEFEAIDAVIRQIVARGLNFGVHLLLTAARWSEVHHGMRDQIGTRLELRLGDPVDSAIDLRAAATVPQVPGRGMTAQKYHFLAGLPRIDGDTDPSTVADGSRGLAAVVEEFWDGDGAPPVRTLPAVLDAVGLPAAEGDLRVVIGLDEEQMGPVWHDFEAVPHLTVMGDSRSGKSNFLRYVATALTRRFTPREVRILAVDVRRSLYDAIPEEYRLGYSVSVDSIAATVADAVNGLRTRVPGPDVTPEQLRRRDWWSGPRLYVLVDDYDLVSGHESPLLPLLPFLAQGTDIGLHLVLTRAAAGAMRMSMDPLVRRLQETNSPDVVLSCPPSEGPLLGNTKAKVLPPGRALLCTRRGSRLIQTPFVPTESTVDADEPATAESVVTV